ncbi:hypothetical protein MMC22_003256 [Lobaria immixta]|nr:hypothetical protein [Lobaria immixta]
MVNAEKPTNKSMASLYLHSIPAHVEISEIEAADAEKLKEQIMSSISLSDSKLRQVMERYVTLHLASMASRSHPALQPTRMGISGIEALDADIKQQSTSAFKVREKAS